jgi:hypothetical protein
MVEFIGTSFCRRLRNDRSQRSLVRDSISGSGRGGEWNPHAQLGRLNRLSAGGNQNS